jgi:hypothetical protein
MISVGGWVGWVWYRGMDMDTLSRTGYNQIKPNQMEKAHSQNLTSITSLGCTLHTSSMRVSLNRSC